MHTEQMTPAEMDRLNRFAAMASGSQATVLAARKRTGLRVGVQVERGGWFVGVTSYELNSKGAPKGTGKVRTLCGPVSEADAIAFVEAM